MESLYLRIAERLRSLVPELDHIDEDTGQLYPVPYDDRYSYPILFPCCLIDATTADFKAEKFPDIQRGTVTVTVKVAFQCDEDTHYDSGGTFAQMEQRLAVNRKVVSALHGYRFGDDVSEMRRTQARAYPLAGRVKVYESTFNVNVTEEMEEL